MSKEINTYDGKVFDASKIKFTPEEANSAVNNATKVVANPPLAGTEAELTGIEIGGTKYKAGGGGTQLYLHTITFTSEMPDPELVVTDLSIITTTNTTLENKTDITDIILSAEIIKASLSQDEGESRFIIIGSNGVEIYYLEYEGVVGEFNIGFDWTITDTVTAL